MTLTAAPRIETDRLILRAPREADFAAMLAFNDSPRAAFVGGGAPRQQIWRGLLANIGLWALRGYGLYSVESKAGDFIGRVGVLFHDGWHEPELGWHLYDGYEGRGYALEAARAAQADYHARISPAPLISYIDPANQRSQALAGRLGAIPERDTLFFDKPVAIWRHCGPDGPAQGFGDRTDRPGGQTLARQMPDAFQTSIRGD